MRAFLIVFAILIAVCGGYAAVPEPLKNQLPSELRRTIDRGGQAVSDAARVSTAGARGFLATAHYRLRRELAGFRGRAPPAPPQAMVEGRDIRNSDFSGADLSKVSFAGSNLSGAKFVGALMHETNFEGAVIRGADFRLADLEGAALLGGDGADASFRDAKLAGASFLGAMLANADFRSAEMTGARMGGANLSGASFAYAQAAGAQFVAANLRDADFTGADLSGAALKGANAASAVFDGADLTGAAFADLVLTGADLSRAVGVTQKQLEAACGDETTAPPPGMRLPLCRDRGRYVESLEQPEPTPAPAAAPAVEDVSSEAPAPSAAPPEGVEALDLEAILAPADAALDPAPPAGPASSDQEVIDVYFGETEAERDRRAEEADAYLEDELLPQIERLLSAAEERGAQPSDAER